jgi:hypothetical protein
MPSRNFTVCEAAVRYAARYVLKTDVARFYHSIYTHSIPWVIHGKAAAKKKQRETTARMRFSVAQFGR